MTEVASQGRSRQTASRGEGNTPRILIVSPVKDEAEYLERTIASIAAQTIRPALWLIVNDGSQDATGSIADAAAHTYPWIRVLHRPARTVRSVGPGVIEAFHAGLESVDLKGYEFVCKLDGDLEVDPRYFENLLALFAADPRLGTASGKVYVPRDGRMVLERTSDQFSIGAAKFYRRECFEQIGGFVREVMWDGIDCHRCRMLGWKAVSTPDPALAITHFRPMGSSHQSIYHGRRRWGRGQYFMGTHPVYICAIAAYRIAERPWVLGGLNILLGYLHAAWNGVPRYDDPEFRRHLHRWQFAELGRLVCKPFLRARAQRDALREPGHSGSSNSHSAPTASRPRADRQAREATKSCR